MEKYLDIVSFSALSFVFIGILGLKSTKGNDIMFNVTKTVMKSTDDLILTCMIAPTIKTDTLYFIEISKLNTSDLFDKILRLQPNNSTMSVIWIDLHVGRRAIANSSKTENYILRFKIPAQNVLDSDTGTFNCRIKWLTQEGIHDDNVNKSIKVVDPNPVTSTVTFHSISDWSEESTTSITASSYDMETDLASYNATVNTSNSLISRQTTLILGLSIGLPLSISVITCMVLLICILWRKKYMDNYNINTTDQNGIEMTV